MARRKNTRRFDPRYFMDEKTEKLTESRELENAPLTGTYEEQGANDAEKALSSGELTPKPRYEYPSDILPSGKPLGRENYRDYMRGFYDALEDADDAEERRKQRWDDYYAEDDFYRGELDESANDMGPLGTMTRPSQVFRGTDDAVYDSALAYKKAGIAAPAPRTYATNNGYIAAVDDQGNVYVYVPGSEQHQKSRRYKFMDVIDMLKSEGFKEARFYVPGSAR